MIREPERRRNDWRGALSSSFQETAESADVHKQEELADAVNYTVNTELTPENEVRAPVSDWRRNRSVSDIPSCWLAEDLPSHLQSTEFGTLPPGCRFR